MGDQKTETCFTGASPLIHKQDLGFPAWRIKFTDSRYYYLFVGTA